MTQTDIRALRFADLTPLKHMIAALARHHGDTARICEQGIIRLCFGRAPLMQVYVAEAATGLVGYIATTRLVQLQTGRLGCVIDHLYVDRAARNSGVGTALVACAKAHAEEDGCSVLIVSTTKDNTQAQAFYQSLGFWLGSICSYGRRSGGNQYRG